MFFGADVLFEKKISASQATGAWERFFAIHALGDSTGFNLPGQPPWPTVAYSKDTRMLVSCHTIADVYWDSEESGGEKCCSVHSKRFFLFDENAF